ncbi:MAG: S4 domain-containing protein YaaA [Candidatus Izemoplasmatales bacterium]|nr:S4 domain-containing protein YaaA [Candidatus Izemoplasmatales bacterium]
MKTITIQTEYITLGQLLKYADIISNGGEAKSYLEANNVFVNNEQDQRRGRKLYPGDKVNITTKYALLIAKAHVD